MNHAGQGKGSEGSAAARSSLQFLEKHKDAAQDQSPPPSLPAQGHGAPYRDARLVAAGNNGRYPAPPCTNTPWAQIILDVARAALKSLEGEKRHADLMS